MGTAQTKNYNSKLQSLIESLNFVTDVRINPQAESIIVAYKYKKISCAAMLAQLEQAIKQVALPVEPPPAPEKAPPVTINEETPQPDASYEVDSLLLYWVSRFIIPFSIAATSACKV